MQNYLVFQPVFKTHTCNMVIAWGSKGFSDEGIKPPATSNNSLNLWLNCINVKIRIKFDGSCLKQEKVTFNHKTILNLYIAY